MSANGEVLWMLAEHLALTAAPGVAIVLLLARRGVVSVPILLAAALAASGLVAIVAFWAYYQGRTLGQAWVYLVLLGSIAAIVWTWREGRVERRLLRALATPLLLWALAAVFVVYLGFLHGGTDDPVSVAATRYAEQLPTDNDIPQYFANWFYDDDRSADPPVYPGEWLSSDRPPLQIGYVLSQRTFAWDPDKLHYQVLSALLQQLWVIGLWAVLVAARLRPRARALTICAALVSDVAIVHGFFVWPKLLAAAFVLAGFALVLSPEWARLRSDVRGAALLACLCALAMLAHGASIFGIVPLLAFAFAGGLPSRRWLGVGALVGVALLAPWSAYQRYADPPGNRLLKWQLGGQFTIDDRGTLETIREGYEDQGLAGTLGNKKRNFVRIVGGTHALDQISEAVDYAASGRFGEAVRELRLPRFFSVLPFLGLLLIGPLAMLVSWARRRTPEEVGWRFALRCFAFAGIAFLFWGLALFGTPDASTTIHVGSLAVPLLALAGCVAGLYAVHRRLAIAVVAVNALGVLALYIPSLKPPPESAYSPLAAALAAAALAGFCLLAFRDREPA